MGRIGPEVEVAVAIHRRDLKHCHMNGREIFQIIAGQLGIADWNVVHPAAREKPALQTGQVPGVPRKMAGCLRHLQNRRFTEQDPAADLDIFQFLIPLCQRTVQQVCGGSTPAIVDPISGFHTGNCPGRCCQLFLILLLNIHVNDSFPFWVRVYHGADFPDKGKREISAKFPHFR